MSTRTSIRHRVVRLAWTLAIPFTAGPLVHAQPPAEEAATSIVWTPIAPMPTPRMDFGVAVANQKVYAIGGFSGSTLSRVDEYDPANDSWTRKADLPTPRRLLVVTAVNDKVYAIGGASFTDPNALTYSFATDEYDPATNAWRSRADIPLDPPPNGVLGNMFIGGAAANGKIYVVVFNTNMVGTTATYQYDPVQNAWDKNKAPVPFGFTRYSVAALNGHIYALGADVFFGTPPFAEYDPVSNVWTTRPSPSVTRSYPSLVAAGSRLYAVGGLSYPAALDTVEEYDPQTHTWQTTTPLLTGRHSAGAAGLGGRIFVMGGADASNVPMAAAETGDPGGPSFLPTCELTPGLAAGTLTLHFDLRTPQPVRWNLWLSYGTTVARVWSVPLTAQASPVPVDVPLPNFPAAGRIGFLTTFANAGGIACSSWRVVDTGSPAAAFSPAEIQGLVKEGLAVGR